MSSTYTTRGGETWNEVARSTTGNDLDAATIQRANPGVLTPMPPGVLLQIPIEAPEIVVDSDLELQVKVEGERLGTLDDFALALSVDAISKCGFTIPNEPETRALFGPLKSPQVTVDANGARVFTGRAESPVPANSPDERSLDINCYSLPGVLERNYPPLTAFPLEWVNSPLPAIAADLCAYHGIAVDFRSDPGAIFPRVDIEPGKEILAFLSELAAQRGPVMTSGPAGQLVFWNGTATGSPVSKLEKGFAPAEDVGVQINEDRYYSSVTGTIPAKSKKAAAGKSFTVDNPFATDLVRPYTFECKDIDPGELETAVQAAAGRMFAGIFSVSLEVSTWYDEAGELYQPNTTIELKSPDDYILDFYEFLISDVVLSKSSSERKASLTLVLPGVFSGEIPERLPWQ